MRWDEGDPKEDSEALRTSLTEMRGFDGEPDEVTDEEAAILYRWSCKARAVLGLIDAVRSGLIVVRGIRSDGEPVFSGDPRVGARSSAPVEQEPDDESWERTSLN